MAKMDLAHRETDKLIEDLEKRIDETYARAARETQAKLDKYLKSFEKKDAEKKKLVDAKQMKQSEYEKWRIGQVMTGKRWEEMSKTLATDLAHADYIAQKITQDSMIDAYALNHNYATYEVEKGSMVDTSYTMYDHDTAERLIAKEPQLLPKASEKTEQKIREGKLIRWNQQKITSEVTQSILQGESVDKMARRMRNVTDMDRRASIRNARTSMTGAQNAGRQDGYERAQEMGIDTEKQWMAVMDDRTRHWHVELDGEHVPVDEPFHNEYGDIEYPGDPNADPANVYNCRCTMICRIKGFEKDFTDRTNEALGDMSYEDWKQMHAEKQAEHGYVRAESTSKNVSVEIPAHVRKDIDAFMDKYQNASTEHYLAINANGEKIYESPNKGGRRAVSVPSSVDESNFGGYSVHNHPAEAIFSSQDIFNYERYGEHGFVVDNVGNEYMLFNTNPVSVYKEVRNATNEELEKLVPFSMATERAFHEIDDKILKERREFSAELVKTESNSAERGKKLQDWMQKNNPEVLKDKWLEENAEKYGFIYKKKKR